MSLPEKSALPPELYQQIHGILHAARQQSYRAVNTAMVEAYWQIGRRIVEQIRYALRSNLTWTHLRQLMRLYNLDARNWYMNEGWSACALLEIQREAQA